MRYVLVALTTAVVLMACGSGSDEPVVSRMRPERVEPGGLLLVSGQRLTRVTSVTIGGLEASDVTHVNDTLLSLTAPAALPPGRHALELHVSEGAPTVVAVDVKAAVAPPPAAVQAQPTATPTPTPSATPIPTRPPISVIVPAPQPAPPPPFAPPKRDDDDDDDDKKPGNQNGNPNQNGNGRGRGR